MIDPAGDARRVLQTAVAERGPGVLSDPATMDGICRARLQGMPGETILIGSAARSNVPALLQQQVSRLGLDGAIQDIAANVARTHQLDLGACTWVVQEYARALGYPVPGSPGDAGAVAGPAAGGPAQYYPPTGPLYSQPPQQSYQQVPQQPYQQAPAPLYPQGGGTPRRRPRLSRGVLGIIAAAAVVIVYIGVAAAAHLAPFGKAAAVATPTPTPHPSRTVTSTSPSPSASVNDTALWDLIPGTVRDSNCTAIRSPLADATEEITCNQLAYATGTTDGFVAYYLYPDDTALKAAYDKYVLTAQGISTGEGACGDFDKYAVNCETSWDNTSPAVTGRVAEYVSDGTDALATTENQQDILMYVSGASGNGILAWWDHPRNWVVTISGA